MTIDDLVLTIRPDLTDGALNELFTAAWPDHRKTAFEPLLARSLTWVALHRGGRLVGYVNVVGDGGAHAFVLDTTVHPDEQRGQASACDWCAPRRPRPGCSERTGCTSTTSPSSNPSTPVVGSARRR